MTSFLKYGPNNLQNTIINPDVLGYGILVLGSYVYISYVSDIPSDELQVYELDYAYSVTVLSDSVYTTSTEDFSIDQATLTADDTIPADTSIDYYLSADNGTNWEEVESGVTHSFTNRGMNLKWKALLQTTVQTVTPVIDEINITIKSILNPPSLNAPIFYEYNHSRISCDALNGAVLYLFQLDTVDTFDSPNLVNGTSGSTGYGLPFLQNGSYYYRIAGIDSDGYRSIFSVTNILVIGTIATTTTTPTTPTTPETPINPLMLIILGAIGAISIVAIVIVMQRKSKN